MVVSVAEMSKMLERSPSYEPFQDPTTGRPIEGLTTVQMGAHLGISAKEVGRVVQLYGEKAAAIALHQVGRKIEGKRIGFYQAPRVYNLAYQRFIRLPKIAVKRDIAIATKIKAREAGFPTVEEYVAAKRQLLVLPTVPAKVIKRVPAPPARKPPIPEPPIPLVPPVPVPGAPPVITLPTPLTKEELEEAERLKRRHQPIEYAKEKIDIARGKVGAAAFYTARWLKELVDPEVKAARKAAEEAFKKNEDSVKLSNTNAEKINTESVVHKEKWEKMMREKGGLTQKEIKQEESERFILNRKIKRWRDNVNLLTQNTKELRLLNQKYEITKAAVPLPIQFLKGVVTGFVTAPLGVAGLALGAITGPPGYVAGEIGRGIMELPGEFMRRPFEVAGEITGAVAFYQLAGAGIAAGVKKAASLTGLTKLKTSTSQILTITRARQVGKVGKLRLWRVEGRLLTVVKQFGRKPQVIETYTFSEVISGPTKAGAIKAFSSTWAGSVRIMAKSVKGVTAEISITKSGGRTTFSSTSVEKLWRGRGAYSIKELARMRTYLTKKGAKIKYLKVAPPYEALADIWAKELGVKERFFPVTKRIPGQVRFIARGKEYYLSYKSVVDIFGKKKADTILRVHARGLGSAFVPEEWIAKLPKTKFLKLQAKPIVPWGKKAELLPRVDITKTTPELQKLVQVGKLKVPPEALVKITVAPEVKAIGELLAKRIKLRPRLVPVTRFGLALKAIPRLRIAPGLALTTLQRQELKARGRALQTVVGLKAVPRLKPVVAEAFAVTPALKVAPRLIAPAAPLVPPAAPVPLFIPPVPPVISPFFIPRPTKKQIEEEKKRKRLAAKLKAQALAYQASVGAAITGVEISAKEAAKIKRLTGLELRPVVVNQYTQQLRKQQSFLTSPAFGTAKKGSPTKAVKMLRAQQEALVAPAWGGRAKQRKSLQKQAQEVLKRMKMYAKKKKSAMLKIPKKKKTRKQEIIQRLNKLFA